MGEIDILRESDRFIVLRMNKLNYLTTVAFFS
jgi:hypothetical protein